MTASSSEPVVEILGAEALPGRSRVTCRFDRPYSEPIAPGGLYGERNSGSEVFVVHRVIDRQGDVITFETFGIEGERLPSVGASFFFRGWWLPAAMKAALDTEAPWEHRRYPDNGDHDHCLFNWETIAAYAEQKAGWWSAKHGWVSEKAYQDFIANDVYHLRESHDA